MESPAPQLSAAVHLVRESLTAHQLLVGSCWQHEAIYPYELMPWLSSKSRQHLVSDTCTITMKRNSLSFQEPCMKQYPLRRSTQIQRYTQVLRLRKGHQKGNLAFINNGEVCEQRWFIREPDSALLSCQSFLAVCEVESA